MDGRTLLAGTVLGGLLVGGAALVVGSGSLPAPGSATALSTPDPAGPAPRPPSTSERPTLPALPPLQPADTPADPGAVVPLHPHRPPGGGGAEALADGRPYLSAIPGMHTVIERRAFGHVRLNARSSVEMPAGEVRISGDWSSEGDYAFPKTTLVFDGTDQMLSGSVRAKRIIFRGGVKRLTGGSFGTSSTSSNDLSKPDEAYLVVEPGATLLIRDGAEWKTSNPYGYRIEGTVEIDGGTFEVTFANGAGKKYEDSWRPGSRLIIRRGLFHASGDQAFRAGTIEMHGGKLIVDDDIWSLGERLLMYGGELRNSKWGGMFQIHGSLEMSGGTLQANQSGDRGFRVRVGAVVNCTGGTVEIGGSASGGTRSGIYIGESTVLPNVTVNVSSRIHSDSPKTSGLAITGRLRIKKDQTLTTTGWNVMASHSPDDDEGKLIR
jgi:hypothetical protein